MLLKRTLFSLLVLTLFVIPAFSQRTITSLSLQIGLPQDEYQDTYNATGIGFRWNVMHRPKDSPLSVGGELGFLINGRDARTFDIFYLGFYDRYRITATNNILSIGFKVRADLVSNESPMQIFVDATVGTNLFFSSVDVARETYYGQNETTAGRSSKGHWAFVWGPGLGVEIPFKSKETALVVKGSYLFGSRAKYLTDPYIDNDAEVYFTERESETTMLVMELGLRFGVFNKNRR